MYMQERLTDCVLQIEFPADVSESCCELHPRKGLLCFLHPMMSNWTKLLIRFFRSKDEKTRELRLMAPESLENLMAENRGATVERVEFNIYTRKTQETVS